MNDRLSSRERRVLDALPGEGEPTTIARIADALAAQGRPMRWRTISACLYALVDVGLADVARIGPGSADRWWCVDGPRYQP